MSELKVISYSELDTIRQCPHKHQLGYVERWTSGKDPMSALGKGTAWHAVLERHYRILMRAQKEGWVKDRQKVNAALHDAILPFITDLPDPELAELITWMYTGFVEHWGYDDAWEILAVEHNAACRLRNSYDRPTQFLLKMKLDLVVRERQNGHIRVVDHKSGKDLPHGKLLEFDDQFGLYTWGMRQLGKKVWAQTWDAARTYRTIKPQPLPERFERVPMYRTSEELNRIALDAYETAKARYQQINRGEAPRHPNTQTCGWRCDFTDACLLGRKTTDEQERDFLRAKGFVQDFSRH